MPVHFPLSRLAVAAACSLLMLQGVQAQTDKAPEPKPAETPALVQNSALTGPMLNLILLGELESQRGQAGQAYVLLFEAARRSGDEGLYRRATEIALKAGDGATAIKTIEAWRAALPQSFNASVYEVRILIELNRPADAAKATSTMLKLASAAEREGTITVLPRLFSRNKNKVETAALLEPVLKPWMADVSTALAAHVALGRFALAANNSTLALQLTQHAHALQPTADSPALLALELMPVRAEAQAIVESYLRAKPDGTPIRIVFARLLGTMQRFSEAEGQLQYITRNHPQLGQPWLTLAAVQLEVKQPNQAITTLKRYLARESSGKIDPPTGPAAAATGQDDADDTGDGDNNNAGDEADTLAPSTVQAYFLLAKAYEQLRQFDTAEIWLNKVSSPYRAMDVLPRRLSLLTAQGKHAKALETVRRTPETSPEVGRTKAVLESQLLSDQKEWASSEKVLAVANQRFPNDADLLYQQAMVAEKLDHVDDMERMLRKVIELRPDHHHAYNALGYSLAERNLRLPEARALIATALELAPNEPFITDSLGWVEYRLGNRREALRLLNQAYRLRPDVEIGVHLGEVLWVEGQYEEARRVLREAQKRDATNEVLRSTILRLKVDL
ncbi:MAG: hypothetical protein RLZZ618_2301 [Pseudomonadota bacterium]|jgi:tetratricopeptide (TPR) repeat protein